jgi:hypothetical protein
MPTSSPDVSSHRTLTTAALERWRGWAETLADNGSQPSPLEILEAGVVLGIPQPMAALEADAKAIADVRQLEAAIARQRGAMAARLAADGGPAGVRERLAAARAEVRRLEKLVGMDPRAIAVGQTVRRVDEIRRDHPRAFLAAAKAGVGTAAKKTTRKRKVTA